MERVAQAALFLFLVAGFLFLVSGSKFLVVSYLVQILLTRNQEPATIKLFRRSEECRI